VISLTSTILMRTPWFVVREDGYDLQSRRSWPMLIFFLLMLSKHRL